VHQDLKSNVATCIIKLEKSLLLLCDSKGELKDAMALVAGVTAEVNSELAELRRVQADLNSGLTS
jgi:hypothetical protein